MKDSQRVIIQLATGMTIINLTLLSFAWFTLKEKEV